MVPANYFDYAASRESGGDPNATNPLSSSRGLYGFLDSTRNAVANKYGIDPNDDASLMQAFTADNAATLQKAGYQPTNANLYLAHHFGAGGALKALSANPNAMVSDVFPEVIRQNPDLRNKRISDITGNTQGATSMAAPQTSYQYGPQDSDPGSLSSRLMAGGPGALFGAPGGVFPGADGTPGEGYDLGRHLQNAGAGLIAISNPAGGAALQNAANMPLFRNRFSVSFDKRGYPMIFDQHRGTLVPIQPQSAGGPSASDPRAIGQSPEAQLAADKALADSSNKEYEASTAADTAAKNTLSMVQQARDLVNNAGVHQGASGELYNEVKKGVKAYTGYDMGGTDQGDMLDKLAGQLAANQAKAMGVTRYAGPEIKMAQSSTLNLDRTKEANLQTLANLEHLAQQTIAQHQARTEYMKNNHGVLGPGFQKYLDQAVDANPGYTTNPSMLPAQGAGGGKRPPLSSFQQ